MQQLSSKIIKRTTAKSIENQVVVVLQHVIGRDTTASCVPDHGHSVSSFEVGLNQLIVPTIAEHHAAEFQALDAQQIDRLLTFVGESEVLGVPAAEENYFSELAI